MNTIVGKFPNGMTIAGVTYTGFEMQEVPSMSVLFQVEEEVSAEKGMKFNGALMCHQLTRVGVLGKDGKSLTAPIFDGPFIPPMIEAVKPADYWAMRKVQVQLDKAGKA